MASDGHSGRPVGFSQYDYLARYVQLWLRPKAALGNYCRGHEEMTGRQPKVLLLGNVRSETVRPTVRPESVLSLPKGLSKGGR